MIPSRRERDQASTVTAAAVNGGAHARFTQDHRDCGRHGRRLVDRGTLARSWSSGNRRDSPAPDRAVGERRGRACSTARARGNVAGAPLTRRRGPIETLSGAINGAPTRASSSNELGRGVLCLLPHLARLIMRRRLLAVNESHTRWYVRRGRERAHTMRIHQRAESIVPGMGRGSGTGQSSTSPSNARNSHSNRDPACNCAGLSSDIQHLGRRRRLAS